MIRDLPHLASRLFGTPLLVDQRKLDLIIPVFLRRLNGEGEDVPAGDPARDPDAAAISGGVAVIPIIGSMVHRKNAMQAYSGMTSYSDIACALDGALADARVRAILLQVDSYGGEAHGCFELCDKIIAAGKVKPIWTVCDVTALSGGYAIACASSRIIIAPSGEAGSIGVVAVHCERSQLNEAMGLTYTVFRAGARKADGNPFEALAPEFATKLQASMDRNRDKFAKLVARGRKLPVKAIMATEGQWYDAEEALAMKLVDSIGVYEDAFAELSASVALPPAPKAPPEPPAPAEEDDDEPAVLAQPGVINMKPDDETAAAAAAAAASTVTAPAAPAVPAVSAAPGDNVVQLDAARAEGRTALAAEHREMAELCQLAGRPNLALDFIASGKSVAEVRKALVDARAAEDAKLGEISNHLPSRQGQQQPMAASPDKLELWARAYDRANGKVA